MFENLVGNDDKKNYLENAIKNNNISHSYMFCGKKGIGKKLFAKEFSREIICKDQESYLKFDSNNHPDFKIIESDGKSIKIDQIRSFEEEIAEKPILSKNKIYIIDDAELMTEESQNSLLKTLEEPPEYAIIILIVENESKILPTIKSRCIKLKFNRISNEDLKKVLNGYSDEEIDLLQGSFIGKDNIEEKKKEYDELEKIVDILEEKNLPKLLISSDILYNSKDNIIEMLNYLNVILLKRKFFTKIEIVEKTKKKIEQNNNYEMCIDYLLMNLV